MPDLANNSNPSLSSPLAVALGSGGGAAGAGLKLARRALAGVVPDREPARERNPHPQNGGAAPRRHAARMLGYYVGDWAARKAGSGEARSRCFLPFLVGAKRMIVEMNPEDEAEEDGANIDLDSQRKGKCVVLKTLTRHVWLLGRTQSLVGFTCGTSSFNGVNDEP